MKYYRHLKKIGINSELLPVPRKFSSDCGVAVSFTVEGDISHLISKDIQKIYLIQGDEGQLLYNNDQD
jgi:hypothetical protein